MSDRQIDEVKIAYDENGIAYMLEATGNAAGHINDLLQAETEGRLTVQKHGRWERGAIISGYQGIGKSTLANVDSGYIDLESGNFFVDGKRAEDWYIPYCQIATHLAEQGYRVFVSSHAVVREHLASLPKSVDLYVCFPSYSLRRQWEAKLEARYNASQKDKDYRAWKNAEDRYAENIKELYEAAGFIPIVIHDMSYDLGSLLDLNCGGELEDR